MIFRKITSLFCATSFLLAYATSGLSTTPKNKKITPENLQITLAKQEAQSRASIEGWNTRIRRQLMARCVNPLATLQQEEKLSRASIEGWNTRIRHQLAKRMFQEQPTVHLGNCANELCKSEAIERNKIAQLYELGIENLEAERYCQICLESYGNDSLPFPSLCGCEGKFCHMCAEKIMTTDTPRCPFCRKLIDATEQPLTTGNLHLAQSLLDHVEVEYEIDSEASHTTTSDISRDQSFWSEEAYDWARESDSTSQASSDGILFTDTDITSITSSDDGLF